MDLKRLNERAQQALETAKKDKVKTAVCVATGTVVGAMIGSQATTVVVGKAAAANAISVTSANGMVFSKVAAPFAIKLLVGAAAGVCVVYGTALIYDYVKEELEKRNKK